MNDDKPTWWSYFAWLFLGAAFAVSILGIMTIGRFVLPFALVGLFVMLKWGGNYKSRVGLFSGAGPLLIYIAFLNRGGPGMVCGSYKNGGGYCTEEWNPWPWLIVGLALLVTGVVLFHRAREKVALTPEPGLDGEFTTTVPTQHRLDLPISERACKPVAIGAAIWTVMGLIIALSGLSTVNKDAKLLFCATILLATMAGIGAMVSAFRRKRRGAILFLFLSIIFPTYFAWVFSLIPVVLAGYLLFGPFVKAFREPQERRRKIQFLILIIIAIVVVLAWWMFHVDPNASTESKRVQSAFEQMSLTVSNKEGVSTSWIVPMHVGAASYPDGAKASLWVPLPSPEGVRSNCFYLDEPRRGGASGYIDALCMKPTVGWMCTSGIGGTCFQPGKSVNLERNGTIVVGSVGLWAARKVSVTVKGIASEVPVKYGYFIIPGSLSSGITTKFTITLLDKTGAILGTVTNLQATGWGTPK